jgi:hypothetical protein
MLRKVQFFAGEVERIDLAQKRVVVSHGFDHHRHTFEFDYLVIGLGSVTNRYGLSGLEDYALTMKTLADAARSGRLAASGAARAVPEGVSKTSLARKAFCSRLLLAPRADRARAAVVRSDGAASERCGRNNDCGGRSEQRCGIASRDRA